MNKEIIIAESLDHKKKAASKRVPRELVLSLPSVSRLFIISSAGARIILNQRIY